MVDKKTLRTNQPNIVSNDKHAFSFTEGKKDLNGL